MIKVDCGLHGWSMNYTLKPAMQRHGNCAWFEYDGVEKMHNGSFLVGTVDEFWQYVKDKNVPFYRPLGDGELTWVPYGLYRVLKPDGWYWAGQAKGHQSGYVADEMDFYCIAYALTGSFDREEIASFVGSNPYKTVCEQFNIKPPRYCKCYGDVEDNMFTRKLLQFPTGDYASMA